MSGRLAELIREVRRSVEGEKLTDRWRENLNIHRNRWMGGTSNNLGRLAAACWILVDPKAAAAWWIRLLEEEWGDRGIVGAGLGYWDAQEPRSRTYFGETWLSELAARCNLLRVARSIPAGDFTRLLELLERSLARRAADAALCSVLTATTAGGRGQEVYQGMASLATGGRSNHHADHPADHVAHRVNFGRRPPLELHQKEYTRLADAIMRQGGVHWNGLIGGIGGDLRELVAGEGQDPALVERAFRLLGPARTSAPVWTRRYRGGQLACGVDWNPSLETSCTFLVATLGRRRPGQVVSLDRDVVYLHPYGEHGRVRGGTIKGDLFLGRGETWWEDGSRFNCANLTLEDLARRPSGSQRFELSALLPPERELLWQLRIGPDRPPELIFGDGKAVTPPPPPPPPGPRPKPPPAPGGRKARWSIATSAGVVGLTAAAGGGPLLVVAVEGDAATRQIRLRHPVTKESFTLTARANLKDPLTVIGAGAGVNRHLLETAAGPNLVVETKADQSPLHFIREHRR